MGTGGALMDATLQHCFSILEVNPSSSFDAVQDSYRTLMKVWHPDRFPSDDNLRRKAEEKCKQINHAYEILKKEYSAKGMNATSAEGVKFRHPIMEICDLTKALAPGIYNLKIIGVEQMPTQAGTDLMTLITFMTTESGISTKGERINAGFRICDIFFHALGGSFTDKLKASRHLDEFEHALYEVPMRVRPGEKNYLNRHLLAKLDVTQFGTGVRKIGIRNTIKRYLPLRMSHE